VRGKKQGEPDNAKPAKVKGIGIKTFVNQTNSKETKLLLPGASFGKEIEKEEAIESNVAGREGAREKERHILDSFGKGEAKGVRGLRITLKE